MGYDYYARQSAADREAHGDMYGDWSNMPNNYLRRNIWGGSHVANDMVALSMAYEVTDHIPIPDWPHREDFGVTYNNDEDGYVGSRAAEYTKLIEEHLAWHGVSDIPGIPVHKIAGSNDGWHVTALECKAALGIYRQKMAEGALHPDSFGDDLIPFLSACADRDGFETH